MGVSIPFLNLREKEWKVINAVSDALRISDIAARAGLPEYEVSRILSSGKKLSKFRLSFEIDFRAAGILPIAAISTNDLREIPFLRTKRVLRMYGRKLYLYTALIPEEEHLISEWLSYFKENTWVIRAFKRVWWKPSSKATSYVNGKVFGDLSKLKIEEEVQVPLVKEHVCPLDDADAAILMYKMRWPFVSLRKIEEVSEKYVGKRIPHQTLSRHFRKHVLKIWKGNRVWLYRSVDEVPYKILYMEGRDAIRVAVSLVKLPWFHTAYLDVNRALVSGQPPCESILPLLQVIEGLDVEVTELIMEPSMVKVVPVEELLRKLVRVRVRRR